MEGREKNKYISIIILNVFAIIILILVYFLHSKPLYNEFVINKTKANDLYTKINTIKKQWLAVDELQQLLASKNASKDVMDLFKDKSKVSSVIQNKSWKDYFAWLEEEISQEWTYASIINKNDTILWSIIPIFYQYWNNQSLTVNKDSDIIKQQLSLPIFIEKIEKNILNKNNINSYSSLWINNISFDWWETSATPWIPKVRNGQDNKIWSFSLNLDISWKNNDIKKMINQIQASWKISIVNWELISKSTNKNDSQFSNLDNLLITVDSLNLKSVLDSSEKENSWNISLRFYVRWIWYEKFLAIKNEINKNFTQLYSNINSNIKICDNWVNPVCKSENWIKCVWIIRNLSSSSNALKLRIDELNKNSANILNLDINSSLQELLKIRWTYSNIETEFSKCSKILKGN